MGRALRACEDEADVPWHRVVASDGRLAREPERAEEQLRRLRREGARPRAGEAVARWARRAALTHVASYRSGRLYEAEDARLERLDPTRLEGFASEARARARRFTPEGRAAPRRVGLPTAPNGRAPAPDARALARRVAELDLAALERELLGRGVVRLPAFLDAGECDALLRAGASEERFERGVHMEAKGYGVGSYRYWREPLPEPAETLRRELYRRLRELAARFDGVAAPFPADLAEYHARCRARGQARPSSILISYEAGGLNHPHRDAYGPECFPLQLVVVLSRRGEEFEGGDFVLWTEDEGGELEALEVPADRGDLVLFAARRRGARGPAVMHGMRLLQSGRRDALGIVFHLAQ